MALDEELSRLGGPRQVFLYPENWIEWDLRDDKSPFFSELESELLQADLTADTAEEAFRHYLEKLDQVAALETSATYHEVERDVRGNTAVDMLHVFARTAGEPHAYFYRQRIDAPTGRPGSGSTSTSRATTWSRWCGTAGSASSGST